MSSTNGSLQDEELIRQFESCTLASESFHHEDHVKLVWLYVCRYPVLEALSRFTEGLKRFASAHGKSNLYHETITWAYVLLIHERMTRCGEAQSWEAFAAANADLLNWQPNILTAHYRDETLRSELARQVFVFPDRA